MFSWCCLVVVVLLLFCWCWFVFVVIVVTHSLNETCEEPDVLIDMALAEELDDDSDDINENIRTTVCRRELKHQIKGI